MSAAAQSYPSLGWTDPYESGMSGLGVDPQITMSTVSSAGSILAGTAPAWMAASTAAWAIPVIGAAVAGVTLALMAIFSRKGPKQKIATTEIVNTVAGKMEENRDAYLSGPRTASSQAQALANFDAMWQYVVQNCGAAEMGTPGQRCIFERQRAGTCTSQQASDSSESMDRCGIYDMARDNRDPIANDPNVKPDPILSEAGQLIDSLTGQLFSGLSSGGSEYLILAALLVAGAFFIGGTK